MMMYMLLGWNPQDISQRLNSLAYTGSDSRTDIPCQLDSRPNSFDYRCRLSGLRVIHRLVAGLVLGRRCQSYGNSCKIIFLRNEIAATISEGGCQHRCLLTSKDAYHVGKMFLQIFYFLFCLQLRACTVFQHKTKVLHMLPKFKIDRDEIIFHTQAKICFWHFMSITRKELW